MPKLEAVLFDLDGTLIDSIELILLSYEHTLATHDKGPVTRSELLGQLGVPLWKHLREYSDDDAEIAAMVATYREWNLAKHDDLVRPFDGVEEMLDELAGRSIALGIVTSKLRDAALRGLEICGLATRFQHMIAADDVTSHKPEPGPILAGCELLGVEPTRCAYVGDAVADMRAARAAGTLAIAAGWGPFEDEDLRAAGSDTICAKPRDVASIAD